MRISKKIVLIGTFGILCVYTLQNIDSDGITSHFIQRLRKENPHLMRSGASERARPVVRSISPIHYAAGSQVLRTGYPVSRIPNWGAMSERRLWDRSYADIDPAELVLAPVYDLSVLTFPMNILNSKNDEDIPLITTKLFYSTRFFGRYDINAGEFTGPHAGIDLKLPKGTPVAAIADGSVHRVGADGRLGKFVILEHQHPTEGKLFSIYGHLDSMRVKAGESVRVGDPVGTVGMTGLTSAPHLHLQVDRPKQSGGWHVPFVTLTTLSPQKSALWTVHPIAFIEQRL